jgi:hypothetical protein
MGRCRCTTVFVVELEIDARDPDVLQLGQGQRRRRGEQAGDGCRDDRQAATRPAWRCERGPATTGALLIHGLVLLVVTCCPAMAATGPGGRRV